ncbi:MAG: hypothetical protein FWC41_12010 [Firmicutes bacterium]|nr:hypothetical protein [Bacillota bacterium]
MIELDKTKKFSIINLIFLISGILITIVTIMCIDISSDKLKTTYQQGVEHGKQQHIIYINSHYDSLFYYLQKDKEISTWKITYNHDSIIITK